MSERKEKWAERDEWMERMSVQGGRARGVESIDDLRSARMEGFSRSWYIVQVKAWAVVSRAVTGQLLLTQDISTTQMSTYLQRCN